MPPPTVVVAPPPALSPAPPKPGLWAHTWAVAKVAGPAIISVAAIVLSILAYGNQRAANEESQKVDAAAAAASRRHDAEQVSFSEELRQGSSSGVALTVENYSAKLVSNVGFTLFATAPARYPHGRVEATLRLYLDDLPACSVGIVNALPTITTAMRDIKDVSQHLPLITYTVTSMTFTDHNELSWREQNTGQLEPIPTRKAELYGWIVGASYKQLSGCS